MLLAVDIGNTNTVAGVFAEGVLVAQWRVATDSKRMADEYAVLAEPLFKLAGLECRNLEGVIVASVVPTARQAVIETVRSYLGITPLVVSPLLNLGIEVRYNPPQGVGADRIANAVAAVKRYGSPVIVVDFGTGTNFDVIDADGVYIGGAIAPGLEISVNALFAGTSLLPQVALDPPPRAVGRSTVESLQSGIVYGYAGLVDGLVHRIKGEIGEEARVIATGGLAGVVSPHTNSVERIDLDLTLYGLSLIYQNNRQHAQLSGSGQT